jgi:uncharacterized protein
MQNCNQCGKCCLFYADGGLVATASEIDAWKAQRPDIYRYVHGGQIWCSPVSGEPLTRCPWLQGNSPPYACSIYADRPADCRSYPVTITDMVRDECEMLEPKDLNDLPKTQAVLDAQRY